MIYDMKSWSYQKYMRWNVGYDYISDNNVHHNPYLHDGD